MKQILNMAAYQDGLMEYKSKADLQGSCESLGLDGLEVIFCGGGYEDKITPDMVKGVHLCFFPLWLDFWNRNEAAVADELGSLELCREFYGGDIQSSQETYLNWFERDLDEAQQIGAEYVVFHVSEVTINGVYTGHHLHSDLEVVDAAAVVINRLMEKRKDAGYTFLVENLQHPGLNLRDASATKRLLDQIEYENKGIMFDTGHFMGVGRDVHSEQDGIQKIHDMLDAHAELLPYFKGVHLHSGVLKAGGGFQTEDPTAGKFYYDRFSEVYRFLDLIDPHEPFRDGAVKTIVDRINPEWVVHELLPGKRRAQREAAARQQMELLWRG